MIYMNWNCLFEESNNDQMKATFSSPMFEPATEILFSILERREISDYSLKSLYGANSDTIKLFIEDYFQNVEDIRGNIVRKIEKSPKNIFNAIFAYTQESEIKKYFVNIEKSLHNTTMPDDFSLKKVFGSYYEIAKNIIEVYRQHNEKRDSGLYKITHPFYVSVMAYFLDLDESDVILALSHDVKEDNLVITRNTKGDYYSLFTHKEFSKDYLLDDSLIFRNNVLTNYVATILSHAEHEIKKKGLSYNNKNLLEEITLLQRNEYLLEDMGEYLDSISSVLKNTNDEKDINKRIKWVTYDTPYIKNISKLCKSFNGKSSDPDSYVLKILDGKFNGIEQSVPGIDFKVRNLNKQIIIVNNGYSLGLENKRVNDLIEELAQDALRSAYHVLLSLMYNTQFDTAHIRVVLDNIQKLSPVLYTDVKSSSVLS